MKKLKSLMFAGAAALMLSSCATVESPIGAVIFSEITSPVAATANSVGSKVGTAEATSVLGIWATGDASINAAAQSAGITKISHVDKETFHVLGFFARYRVMVYGE